MNEYKSTKEYLKTLKQIYQEKGLSSAVKHEIVATVGSVVGRITRANNYLVSILDLAGDPISLRDVLNYNHEIRQGRLQNIANPNLVSDGWEPANWTEA